MGRANGGREGHLTSSASLDEYDPAVRASRSCNLVTFSVLPADHPTLFLIPGAFPSLSPRLSRAPVPLQPNDILGSHVLPFTQPLAQLCRAVSHIECQALCGDPGVSYESLILIQIYITRPFYYVLCFGHLWPSYCGIALSRSDSESVTAIFPSLRPAELVSFSRFSGPMGPVGRRNASQLPPVVRLLAYISMKCVRGAAP